MATPKDEELGGRTKKKKKHLEQATGGLVKPEVGEERRERSLIGCLKRTDGRRRGPKEAALEQKREEEERFREQEALRQKEEAMRRKKLEDDILVQDRGAWRRAQRVREEGWLFHSPARRTGQRS